MKLILPIIMLLAVLPSAAATVTLDIAGIQGNYTPLQPLAGSVTLSFDELVPQTATLFASFDGNPVTSLSMQSVINPPASYSFQNQPFTYNMTASGTTTSSSSGTQTFSYTARAAGTCGSSSCWNSGSGQDLCDCPANCGPPYPCGWTASFTPATPSTVDASEGLKFIYDAMVSITVPADNNNDTLWSAVPTNSNVQMATHQACGSQNYETYFVSPDGWVYRTIQPAELKPISGTSDKEATIELFQNSSLNQLTAFGGGPGGIFKNGAYQQFGSQVVWDGGTGYIRIYNYDGNANYVIVYLPPNGPQICAYTAATITQSQQWSSSVSIPVASLNYNNPYSRTYSQADLASLLPPPPCQGCTQTTDSYTAFEVSDPSDTVTLAWNTTTSTVSAFTTSTALAQTYTVTIPLSSFTGLNAPASGQHTFELSLYSQGAALSSASTQLAVCQDADSDGFCPPVDCDDADPFVNPSSQETCDGKDNNCNGKVDEKFWSAGSKLGNPCGTGVCAGVYVCTPDGQGAVCNNRYFPGEFPEYCGDGVDNDCDGVTDETLELTAGQQTAACVCKEGQTQSCGTDTGACTKGLQVCKDGVWGPCGGGTGPVPETCNAKDDDCDGIVDNVFGQSSSEGAQCQCYGGALPVAETCNSIDDNCNGRVDEGISCCQKGETRSCGTSTGVCQQGIQSCKNGEWGSCEGGESPTVEICFNNRDDDCDGLVDENCEEFELSCSNSVLDAGEEGVDCGGRCPNACGISPLSIGLAVVVIIVIAVVAVVQLRSAA